MAINPSETAPCLTGVRVRDVHEALARNIVSAHPSQDLFDDLSDDPAAWAMAQAVEAEIKPPPYRSQATVVRRPFEHALWFSAIDWPFQHWQRSRFSDGSFGVWYGSESVATTAYETVYHWVHGFLRDAHLSPTLGRPLVAERKVYDVRCDAALLDFCGAGEHWDVLTHPRDYSVPQSLGARLQREGHPGLVVPSARRPEGVNFAIFNAEVLSTVRLNCQLTYTWRDQHVLVEKQPGQAWLTIDPSIWDTSLEG